ncbi:adenosine kinase isoform X1 [Plutella xylostella]|uniref:adenosine kinase isoform X1 n=1 Tax=Plutella xylostella TaxID=51655 RepID=UPI002032A7D1|nr:adenosine kinase isoform X1 [Plutella xylostella]
MAESSPCKCEPHSLAGKEGLLLGIGNPLLDISATVSESLLQKYDLKPDDAIMAEAKHMPLYKELTEKYKAEFIAGGSVQNSLRVAQWILKQPRLSTYFGCVGNDDYANILRDRAVAEGVIVQYQVTEAAPTGTCAVLVTDTHRSLCANLAAAEKFTPEHLASDDSKALIQKAQVVYTSGFFIAVSPESILQLAAHAHEHKLTFAMNLSAPFVSQFFKEPLEKLLPYVDVLFGNEAEAEAFAKAFSIKETNITAIAQEIAKLPKLNEARPRVVVITQGCDPVVLIEDHAVKHIPVTKLAREQIVDTNGAGDAFAGGFLAQMLLGKDYSTCVKCGIFAATHIIQHSGCTFDGESTFKVDS